MFNFFSKKPIKSFCIVKRVYTFAPALRDKWSSEEILEVLRRFKTVSSSLTFLQRFGESIGWDRLVTAAKTFIENIEIDSVNKE